MYSPYILRSVCLTHVTCFGSRKRVAPKRHQSFNVPNDFPNDIYYLKDMYRYVNPYRSCGRRVEMSRVAPGGVPEAGEADGKAGDEDLRGSEMRYQPLGRAKTA